VEVVKNTLSKAAGDLVQTQAGNEGKGTQLEEKRKKLEHVRKKLSKAKQRLENEKVELMTLEERSAELARVQGDNEDELGAVQKEGIAHKVGPSRTS
jgi:peptidoglycan hydrolase CwlO-like protein